MQFRFSVIDKNGNFIMEFSDEFSSCDTHMIRMNNREYEICGLLLVNVQEMFWIS